MIEKLLTLILLSPLLGILVLAFTPRYRAGTVKLIGILATLIPLLLSFVMYVQFDLNAEGMQLVHRADWFQIPIQDSVVKIAYEVGVDGLSMPMVLLASVIATLGAVASIAIQKRWKEYFILYLIMEIGLLGVFMSLNLFMFFIFFELALIPMFFLIAIWGYLDREKAAMKFLIYNGVGSGILLITFVALFIKTGSLNMAEIMTRLSDPMSPFNLPDSPYLISEGLRTGLFLALLIAFGIKMPFVPLHTWMLKSYQESPIPMIMISSGVMIKMGAYGLIRLGVGFFPQQAVELAQWIGVLGLVSILYGAVLALVQKDLKMVLAYSSVSHMGIVLLGIASMNATGFQGAIFQMVSHGLVAALLIFMVGVIYERTKTTVISELGGLAKSAPFISGVLLTAALASLGLPGMSGFISEFQAFLGLFRAEPVLAAIGTLGIILTAVYMLRAVLATTFGPTPEKWQDVVDARPVEVIPMAVLLGFVILIGIYPAVLGDVVQGTLQNLVPRIGG
ncbi:MAG: NADH-quinone oxidoreductase subunit M [Bacillaceae bacterium]|nr:NADH-quinone oxidoreductase subunit M [Bacillaceae bacterium]